MRNQGVTLLLVFAGGGTGTLLRYLVQQWGPAPADGVDLTTFAINVSGALLLGILTPVLARSPRLSALISPGLLGGFTTYSALLVFPMMASRAGAVIPSITYVVATLLFGTLAAVLGLKLGRTIAHSRTRSRLPRGRSA